LFELSQDLDSIFWLETFLRTKDSNSICGRSWVDKGTNVRLEIPGKLFRLEHLNLVLQRPIKVTGQISVHPNKCLDSERFNNLGDVLKFDVFTQGVLLKMFEKWFRILFVDVDPVFHVLVSLTCELRLRNNGVEHHFPLHSEEPCIYGSSFLLLLEQLHVVGCSVL